MIFIASLTFVLGYVMRCSILLLGTCVLFRKSFSELLKFINSIHKIVFFSNVRKGGDRGGKGEEENEEEERDGGEGGL